ncbi:MAG: tRNA lysidine(34) synthetase TilS [Lachnospiraceae bacterium]|nr:tRNA lysidine(34) synthetase TilS [Lachnospiraceae bacterium]
MRRRIRDFIETEGMLKRGDSVLAGVSGGADSVCLFLLLDWLAKEWELSFEVLHIHHGIRGAEADEDERFVRSLCESRGVRCYVERVDVPAFARREKIGLEEAGRIVRRRLYWHYAKEGQKAAKVALAHHRDDCAESMLLSLVRGTGLAGLCGIRARVKLEDTEIIRPLLCVSRAEIEAYLRDCGQSWRTDSSNASDDYARNFVRNQVMPMLARANPQAAAHMAQTAATMGQVKDFMEAKADGFLREHALSIEGSGGESGIDKAALRSLSPALAGEVMHRWLADCSPEVSFGQVRAALRLASGGAGARIDLPGEYFVESGYEKLYLRKGRGSSHPKIKEKAAGEVFFLPKMQPGETKIVLFGRQKIRFSVDFARNCPGKGDFDTGKEKDFFSIWVNYDRIDKVCVRFPKPGDRIAISKDGKHKKIARLLIDAKVPREGRERIPVVLARDEIFWVVGVRDCPLFFVDEDTVQVLTCSVVRDEMADGAGIG